MNQLVSIYIISVGFNIYYLGAPHTESRQACFQQSFPALGKACKQSLPPRIVTDRPQQSFSALGRHLPSLIENGHFRLPSSAR